MKEPKYKLGSRVWHIVDYGILESTIYGVRIVTSSTDEQGTCIEYKTTYFDDAPWVPEERLFASKELLIQSL